MNYGVDRAFDESDLRIEEITNTISKVEHKRKSTTRFFYLKGDDDFVSGGTPIGTLYNTLSKRRENRKLIGVMGTAKEEERSTSIFGFDFRLVFRINFEFKIKTPNSDQNELSNNE